jgi:hypothetical protein
MFAPGASLVVAIDSVKVLGMVPGYRATDPDLLPTPTPATAEVSQ